MGKKEAISSRSSFGNGPKISEDLLRIVHEIARNSVNTVERKQQANEEYDVAIKNAESQSKANPQSQNSKDTQKP